jgi:hypothetical protein
MAANYLWVGAAKIFVWPILVGHLGLACCPLVGGRGEDAAPTMSGFRLECRPSNGLVYWSDHE